MADRLPHNSNRCLSLLCAIAALLTLISCLAFRILIRDGAFWLVLLALSGIMMFFWLIVDSLGRLKWLGDNGLLRKVRPPPIQYLYAMFIGAAGLLFLSTIEVLLFPKLYRLGWLETLAALHLYPAWLTWAGYRRFWDRLNLPK